MRTGTNNGKSSITRNVRGRRNAHQRTVGPTKVPLCCCISAINRVLPGIRTTGSPTFNITPSCVSIVLAVGWAGGTESRDPTAPQLNSATMEVGRHPGAWGAGWGAALFIGISLPGSCLHSLVCAREARDGHGRGGGGGETQTPIQTAHHTLPVGAPLLSRP